MLSPSVAKLSTYLINTTEIGLNPFTPPLIIDIDMLLPNRVKSLPLSNLYPKNWIYPVLTKFGKLQTSTLLFSFLSGDNVLIVHPDQEVRFRFLGYFLNFIPSTVLQYNRITFGCSELDGNENIVGVDNLPQKYRSHKKLYLPLDTIFVDLVNNKVEGEGIKRSAITDELVSQMSKDLDDARLNLRLFFDELIHRREIKSFNIDHETEPLIRRIENKLNLTSNSKKQDWLMF